ncbi:hypothetical protein HYH02_010485 [Chlamydomonas schloesseri]|uniref:Uncharacterized protein n=1 Tax=Chlamydomonas schloesseri TaxID=2026947 RepID=A0A835T6X7_9CHLO|nr:hypothetical protein HYH02_010485 [Chlamydomonas schloesseri]|eukprot:KAG2439853.1 hypothetical protein HYH02_010485 [Chlamydomonas schloesseri]
MVSQLELPHWDLDHKVRLAHEAALRGRSHRKNGNASQQGGAGGGDGDDEHYGGGGGGGGGDQEEDGGCGYDSGYDAAAMPIDGTAADAGCWLGPPAAAGAAAAAGYLAAGAGGFAPAAGGCASGRDLFVAVGAGGGVAFNTAPLARMYSGAADGGFGNGGMAGGGFGNGGMEVLSACELGGEQPPAAEANLGRAHMLPPLPLIDSGLASAHCSNDWAPAAAAVTNTAAASAAAYAGAGSGALLPDYNGGGGTAMQQAWPTGGSSAPPQFDIRNMAFGGHMAGFDSFAAERNDHHAGGPGPSAGPGGGISRAAPLRYSSSGGGGGTGGCGYVIGGGGGGGGGGMAAAHYCGSYSVVQGAAPTAGRWSVNGMQAAQVQPLQQ